MILVCQEIDKNQPDASSSGSKPSASTASPSGETALAGSTTTSTSGETVPAVPTTTSTPAGSEPMTSPSPQAHAEVSEVSNLNDVKPESKPMTPSSPTHADGSKMKKQDDVNVKAWAVFFQTLPSLLT